MTLSEVRAAEPRFWPKVRRIGGPGSRCWRWRGAHTKGGYASFSVGGRHAYGHVYAYRLLVGPIPRGRELDHLCGRRWCVNPEHLEAVTHAENIRRGRNWNRAKRACPRGHRFVKANTIRHPSRPGRRKCRACQREQDRKYRRRKRAQERAAAA